MTDGPPEPWTTNIGVWTAWVEAGGDERNRRLQHVPQQMREQVRDQVETAFRGLDDAQPLG